MKLRKLLFLTSAVAAASFAWAQTQTGESTGAQAPQSEQSKPASTGQVSGTTGSAAAKTFKPSEKVSADTAVAFPVDI